jgi:predicted glutamine amidotransferase
MCQLFGMITPNEITDTKLNDCVLAVRWAMRTQKNGFGYAFAKSGKLQHGRFVHPQMCRGSESTPDRVLSHLFAGDCRIQQKRSSVKGTVMICHGRIATTPVCLENTHPFHKDGWYIAHNGIVTSQRAAKDMALETTCDSEFVVQSIVTNHGGGKLSEDITGSAAVVGITPIHQLFVLKDNITNLVCATYNGFLLFATTTDIVTEALRALSSKALPRKALVETIPVNPHQQYVIGVRNDELRIMSTSLRPWASRAEPWGGYASTEVKTPNKYTYQDKHAFGAVVDWDPDQRFNKGHQNAMRIMEGADV